jgi:hypothetical protein
MGLVTRSLRNGTGHFLWFPQPSGLCHQRRLTRTFQALALWVPTLRPGFRRRSIESKVGLPPGFSIE